MGLEWIRFFFFVSLSCLHFACVFALSHFFVVSVLFFCLFSFFRSSSSFFRFSLFSLFFLHLCFFLFVSRDFSVFCTFPGGCCRLSLSLRLRETARTRKKREIRSDPVYTNSVRNFPSDAPFSRLRPNDPSSGLTNDTREDPITESHRPIANQNSPKIFWCNGSAQYSIVNYFRNFDGCNVKNLMVERRLQNQFWRPQKVGFVWSVPFSLRKWQGVNTKAEGKRITGAGGPKPFLGDLPYFWWS